MERQKGVPTFIENLEISGSFKIFKVVEILIVNIHLYSYAHAVRYHKILLAQKPWSFFYL